MLTSSQPSLHMVVGVESPFSSCTWRVLLDKLERQQCSGVFRGNWINKPHFVQHLLHAEHSPLQSAQVPPNSAEKYAG